MKVSQTLKKKIKSIPNLSKTCFTTRCIRSKIPLYVLLMEHPVKSLISWESVKQSSWKLSSWIRSQKTFFVSIQKDVLYTTIHYFFLFWGFEFPILLPENCKSSILVSSKVVFQAKKFFSELVAFSPPYTGSLTDKISVLLLALPLN